MVLKDANNDQALSRTKTSAYVFPAKIVFLSALSYRTGRIATIAAATRYAYNRLRYEFPLN